MGTNTTCNDPNFPQFLNYIGVIYCITILSLFTNFYIQSYLKKKTTKLGVDQGKTASKHLANGTTQHKENGNHSETNGIPPKKKHPHSE
ncbi:elongation of very long chain fatty acids protein [Elysia marginata]|uniref:Elongation of very long chain fatty acids protein n=1 Tax=Elysia marginata TaxID=1093978 RepID=A0AAV4JD59_9GAST|nr:elongation of very long chain fatty acids protein [Elysia marginata]